jgi:hypothetical protein
MAWIPSCTSIAGAQWPFRFTIWGLFSSQILPKFHYAKRRFSVTSKCRQMHEVLNVDEIKN